MSKLFSKLGMGEKTARNFITILLIAAGRCPSSTACLLPV